MKHLWNYAVFIMVLTFQRLYACTVPSLEENVSSSCSTGTSGSYNDLCSFSCPTGYNLIGASTVTCTSSGSFSEPFPRCEVITCTVPSLDENVSSSCSTGTSVSYNDRCSFSCPTGYSRAGPSSVTCTGSGSFSQMFPRCVVYACTVPSLEENVSSSCSTGTSVSYNDLCSFSCPTGYNLIGASTVTCTSSGSFSEPFPQCEVITCTVPSFDENVSSPCSSGDSVIYNQQCSFSCPTGYSRAGPSSVTCTGSGSFSQPFPQCVACDPDFSYCLETGKTPVSTPETTPETTTGSTPGTTPVTTPITTPETTPETTTDSTPGTTPDIDNCSSDPCMNGGDCTNGLNTYTCECVNGFTGTRCETVDCNSSLNPCMNGGSCDNDVCTCAAGYTGALCGDATLAYEFNALFQILSGRRKRAAVPIGSTVVQNLLDSIVNAVDSLPEVISVNGIAISANDDVNDLITVRVRLDVTFRNDITIQQLTSLMIASINNIPAVSVQSFGLLTDPCSLDNPCGNGATCERVEPGSANVTCTESTIDTDMATLGVLIGLIVVVVALLLYAVTITVLLIQLRRKVPTKTEENGPDPYMDLEQRPEADRTYQEMAITSTASSTRPGERRQPSSNLIYENQNVAQSANEITGGVDYENVLTPI